MCDFLQYSIVKNSECCSTFYENIAYSLHLYYIFMLMDDELRAAVNRNSSSAELGRIAVDHGMTTLLEDGQAKVASGITTQEELNRSTANL